MAEVYATKNGNWSDVTVWNTGALPLADDDVFADGKTVTIDQDVTVLSIRTTQRSGGLNGGGFNFSTNIEYTLICDIIAGSTTVLNLSPGIIYNIIGNVLASGATTTLGAIFSSNAKVNITINFTGNITASVGDGIRIDRNSNVVANIIGSISNNGGGNGISYLACINSSIHHTGTLIGGAGIGSAISITTGTGPLSLNTTGVAISNAGSAVKNLTDILDSSYFIEKCVGSEVSNAPAVVVSNLISPLKIKFAEYSSVGTAPTAGHVKFVNDVDISVKVTREDDSFKTLIDTANASFHLPLESDVRNGILYNPDLTSIGSLAVPDPSNVRKGVPVDDTVGTADMTPEDFLQALNDSTLPLAVRLKNVATADIVGSQFVAFKNT